MSKEKLFSVTAKDCEWEFFTAGGKGGQNQNKTASACRVRHLPSGAVAECREHREQLMNKKTAFKRMAETPEFKKWIDIQSRKKMGQLALIEEEVERSLKQTRTEIKDENGKWVDAKDKILK